MRLVGFLLGLLVTQGSARITPAEFERLHRELVPQAIESWQTIPWKIDLLAARDAARREKKPLFLWAMNGHPLGCT